jgi:hypothetical protein
VRRFTTGTNITAAQNGFNLILNPKRKQLLINVKVMEVLMHQYFT